MRIALLGSTGQIGSEAKRTLATLGEVVTLDYPVVDFTRPAELARAVRAVQPQVIYNAVAYTAVDEAEREPQRARLINTISVGALAETARQLGALMIHFSSDYVFDGQKGSPYVESDLPNPCNVYGQTKLDGDTAIQQAGGSFLILRTAWVYSMTGDSFVTKVLRWAESQPRLRVVSDQVSSPTWARMLAEATGQILAQNAALGFDSLRQHSGLYHLAGAGQASRLEWAQEILRIHWDGAPSVALDPALTADFPTPARRPLQTVLDCSKFSQTFSLRLPPWQQALAMAMQK